MNWDSFVFAHNNGTEMYIWPLFERLCCMTNDAYKE